MSILDDLGYVVQCRRKSGTCGMGWYTIAAFDCEPVAKNYAKECADPLDWPYEYRVVAIKTEDRIA